MIRLIITFLLLTFAASPLIMAEDNGDTKTPTEKKKRTYIHITKIDPPTTKPRMPAKAADIECYYCDGIIYVSFEEPEGNATLRVEDLATFDYSVFNFSTSSTLTVNIGEISGTLQLEISTAEGNNYIGYLTE